MGAKFEPRDLYVSGVAVNIFFQKLKGISEIPLVCCAEMKCYLPKYVDP